MSERRDRAAKFAAGAKLRVEFKLNEIWWNLLSRGLLALGLAACAFVWPQQTLQLLIKLLGAYILIDGVVGAIGSYRSGARKQPAIQAIVSLAAGSILLFWPSLTAKFFLIFVGVWLVLQGLGLYLSSRRIEAVAGERGLIAWVGGIMALIGIVFVFWTDTGIVAISWLIGLAAFVTGSLLIYVATRIKRLGTRIAHAGGQPL
jgi:uncharacterized membrane protein HdeD (DUF308 family)